MAYTKLPVCDVDYALGYQTITKASDNVDALYAAWSFAHGALDQLAFVAPSFTGRRPAVRLGQPHVQAGHHNDVRICRDVVQVTLTVATGFAYVTPDIAITPSWYVTTGRRTGTGAYQFDIAGLSTFWAHATPLAADNSTTKIAIPRSIYPTSGTVSPSITVNCFEISGGSFGSADMSFTLAISGMP